MKENVQRHPTGSKITEALTHYIVLDEQLLSDNMGYSHLFSLLEVRYEISSRHHITETVSPNGASLSRGKLEQYSAPQQTVLTVVTVICSGSVWGVNLKCELFWCFGIRYDSCCDRASETLTKETDMALKRRFTDLENKFTRLHCICTWSEAKCVSVCISVFCVCAEHEL